MTHDRLEPQISPGAGLRVRLNVQIGDEGTTDVEVSYGIVMHVAGRRLARTPFATVTIEDIAADSGLPVAHIHELFTDMHEIGAAILDHERASMRAVQERVSRHTSDALERIVIAFRMVGENLASDVIVRAGVRLAAESRDRFPERRLDPFRTWDAFVTTQLTRAREVGLLIENLDMAGTTRIVVAAGMGTKDLVAFHDDWDQAPARLEAVMRSIVSLIRATADETSEPEPKGRPS